MPCGQRISWPGLHSGDTACLRRGKVKSEGGDGGREGERGRREGGTECKV